MTDDAAQLCVCRHPLSQHQRKTSRKMCFADLCECDRFEPRTRLLHDHEHDGPLPGVAAITRHLQSAHGLTLNQLLGRQVARLHDRDHIKENR